MFPDPKYFILAINRATGRQIPPHVPLMLFNARDDMALAHAVVPYAQGCEASRTSPEQIASANERVAAFFEFSQAHSGEMRMPGSTAATTKEPIDSFPVSIDGHYTFWLSGGNVVQFVKPDETGKLLPGTTTEEVLEMLIQRLTMQNLASPNRHSTDVLYHLTQALRHQGECMKAMASEPEQPKGETLFGIFMHSCESSNVESYGYNTATKTLALQFTRSHAIYHYKDVPEAVYNGLIESKSIGSYVASQITKGQFDGARMNEPAQA